MTSTPYRTFRQVPTSAVLQDEHARVDELAQRLIAHLDAHRSAIDAVHVHGAGSSAVQKIVSRLLTEGVGFDEEVVITPQDGLVTRARPDFYYSLGPGRGIIAEVERGGTTTNNHDLKDFWKAHISPNTHHLFLIVPVSNWKKDGSARERPFVRVCGRIGAFFGDPRREVDVLSAHVFGYGDANHAYLPEQALIEGADLAWPAGGPAMELPLSTLREPHEVRPGRRTAAHQEARGMP